MLGRKIVAKYQMMGHISDHPPDLKIYPFFWGSMVMGVPIQHIWFTSWKITSFEMDDDWGHLHDSGKRHINLSHPVSTDFGHEMLSVQRTQEIE